MQKGQEAEEEWKKVGEYGKCIIEAKGDKRRLVKDGVVVKEYEVD